MKLGRVLNLCAWGDDSCSGNSAGLTPGNFTHLSLTPQILQCCMNKFNLAGVLHLMSRCAYGEIIHIRQILPGLWLLILRIFTYFSFSSQLLLHCCMDLNGTSQEW